MNRSNHRKNPSCCGLDRMGGRLLCMLLCLLLALCLALSACGRGTDGGSESGEPTDESGQDIDPSDQGDPADTEPLIEGVAIQHETEFGGVYIEITIDDFNALGFAYGDSVDVVFSNGYKLEDIPYYNGYYVDAGMPLLVAYPGYDYVKATLNYGEDLWGKGNLYAGQPLSLFAEAGLDEHCTASVYLHQAGKYRDVQEARDIQYSDNRTKYDSDEEFANFRNIRAGNIKKGVVYRSASPCDNQHNRASYVDALISDAGVNCILNLSDTDEKIDKYMAAEDFDSPYFKELYERGAVIPVALNMNFASDEFRSKIVQGFIEMSQQPGPYLIHCTEGKDRTGFVCMLLEMLAGASYDEIVDDYMVTYANYYKITEESDKAKYDTILETNLLVMMHTVTGEDVDLQTADLSVYARAYLIDAGMTDAQIDALLARITG